MLCKNCPACRTEGNECQETGCALSRQAVEYRKGHGCRLSYNVVNKQMAYRDAAESGEYDGISAWYKRQQKKEQAMLEAIDKQLRGYRYGRLFLCFQDDQSKFCPISGDGKITPELASLILMDYENRKKNKKKEKKEE